MDAERNEVSIHETRIYLVVRECPKRWFPTGELAYYARVSPRTARSHAKKLSDLGILDCAEVFPGHRYRWSGMADKRNASYLRRLEYATEVFANEITITRPDDEV